MIMDNGQITGYQTQGGEPKIEPRLSDESVWLTADLMAELFKWQYMGCIGNRADASSLFAETCR